MEQATSAESGTVQKTPISIEALSKEEIVNKYKGLLGIAKKAKQAKDELVEENRQLKDALACSETQKDADKKALLTMKEMLEQFTENKLQLATQLSELQCKSKADEEIQAQLQIENESLRRQLDRLTEDNESLLGEIDEREDQLKQVNLLGMEQKKHLALLELEVNKLKDAESQNASLQSRVSVTLEENKALKELENIAKKDLELLTEKYQKVKEVNSEQRKKFNTLKERFMEIHRKLKNLKECKRVLLETQHEYGEAVSKWQREIIKASRLLCAQMNMLKKENEQLLQQQQTQGHATEQGINIANISENVEELQRISEQAWEEHAMISAQLSELEEENMRLKQSLEATGGHDLLVDVASSVAEKKREYNEELQLRKDLAEKCRGNEAALQQLRQENDDLRQTLLQRQELEQNGRNLFDKTDENRKKEATEQELQLKELTVKLSSAETEKAVRLQENMQLQAKLSEFATCAENLAEVEDLMAAKQRLQAEIEELHIKLIENDKLREDLGQIRNVIKALEQEKVELLQQVRQQQQTEEEHLDGGEKAVNERQESLQQSYEELLVRYEQKEREHTDLLGEMRELNEALKGRGDVISRQQEKQQELYAELKKTTAKLKELEERMDDKERILTQKEQQLHVLSDEIEATRKKVQPLEEASARHEDQVRLLSEELQNLRNAETAECQSDLLSTSTISRAEELSRLREVDDSFEEKYNKLRGLAMKLKKKLQEQNAHIEELEQERNGQQQLRQELEETKQHLAVLQEEQQQNQKRTEALTAELQKIKSSRKQVHVLNLEIEAAEKSLSEATAKLSAKMGELEALNETLATKEGIIAQLRKEIAIVEAAKEGESTHSKELKAEVDRLQVQLNDAVHGRQSTLIVSKELEKAHERTKLELEELRLQLASSASTQETALSAVYVEKEQLTEQLLALEDTLQRTQASLHTAERSLEDLRIEHLDYKLKAQAVLRKNQSKDTTKERELEEELLALRAMEKQLQIQAQMQLKRSEEGDKQVEQLHAENEELKRRGLERIKQIEELRQQSEHLMQETQTQVRAQQESLRNQRQQIESLDACHKQQIEELTAEVEHLKEELVKTVRQPPSIGAAAAMTAAAKPPSVRAGQLSSSEQSKIDFLLMEREDAEGSDEAAEALANAAANRKISNASRRSQHDFMPLDELLNVPMAAISDTVTVTSNSHSLTDHSDAPRQGARFDANGNTKSTMLELQATKERLQTQESRMRHLTALLAENEQDLAKLTQMNDMLKEELRRQERSEEREQHMQNSEYLKNIFLKFLTLHAGDERTRLVPVLNTILRLSREEVEMLNCVAKGQKIPSETSSRGWNFLPSWGRIE